MCLFEVVIWRTSAHAWCSSNVRTKYGRHTYYYQVHTIRTVPLVGVAVYYFEALSLAL